MELIFQQRNEIYPSVKKAIQWVSWTYSSVVKRSIIAYAIVALSWYFFLRYGAHFLTESQWRISTATLFLAKTAFQSFLLGMVIMLGVLIIGKTYLHMQRRKRQITFFVPIVESMQQRGISLPVAHYSGTCYLNVDGLLDKLLRAKEKDLYLKVKENYRLLVGMEWDPYALVE